MENKKNCLLVSLVCLSIIFIVCSGSSLGAVNPGHVSKYYDWNIRPKGLGFYLLEVTAKERPSNEILPIISNSYFPSTTMSFVTELDNTPPSALYSSKVLTKVDIVFAFGTTSQLDTIENYLPTFESKLGQASNYLDLNVEAVVTDVIDMSAFGAREIFDRWKKMPSNGDGAKVWKLDEENGKIYAQGVKRALNTHRSVAIINDASFNTKDMTMKFTYDAKGPDGQEVYKWNVNENGWSNHISGALFRYNERPNGNFDCYALVIANSWSNFTNYSIHYFDEEVEYRINELKKTNPEPTIEDIYNYLRFTVRINSTWEDPITKEIKSTNYNGIRNANTWWLLFDNSAYNSFNYYKYLKGKEAIETPYIALIKVEDSGADFLPGKYLGTLFFGWCAGVNYVREPLDGSLVNTLSRIDPNGIEGIYYVGVKTKGEGVDSANVTLMQARTLTDRTQKDFTITLEGNNIKVYVGDELKLDVDDTFDAPYEQGAYGLYSFSSPNVYFSNFSIEKGDRKSLGDALSDIMWRDGAEKFIIHVADIPPVESENEGSVEYNNTIIKVINNNAYLINLGTDASKAALEKIGSLIRGTNSENLSVFFNNDKPTVIEALGKAEQWILDKVNSKEKFTNWILVDTPVVWETSYSDHEKDLPLNFGEHDGTKNTDKSDVVLANTWGVGLTHLFSGGKILAEKWRFRHNNGYYDNSLVRTAIHDVWIDNPVEVFKYAGQYRINYKRKDNPTGNANLNDIFSNYRYWSTDYDPVI